MSQCGRSFDRDDPATLSPSQHPPRLGRRLVPVCYVLMTAGCLLGAIACLMQMAYTREPATDARVRGMVLWVGPAVAFLVGALGAAVLAVSRLATPPRSWPTPGLSFRSWCRLNACVLYFAAVAVLIPPTMLLRHALRHSLQDTHISPLAAVPLLLGALIASLVYWRWGRSLAMSCLANLTLDVPLTLAQAHRISRLIRAGGEPSAATVVLSSTATRRRRRIAMQSLLARAALGGPSNERWS